MGWIIFGTMLVSLSLTYAWWVKIRVVCLQQDLFDLRDGLFDFAADHGCLDDEAYSEARNQLNAVISGAELLTIPIVAYMLKHGAGPRETKKSSNTALQQEIDGTLKECVARIYRYLMLETFTGLFVRPVLYAVRISAIMEDQALVWIRRWLRSDSLARFDRYDNAPRDRTLIL